jgi:protein SCO1/2
MSPYVLVATLLALLSLVTAATARAQDAAPAKSATATAPVAFTAGEAPLPGIGGPLDLTDLHGRAFSLLALQGQPTLVFFGFTQCAQTCPVALAQAKQLLSAFRAGKPPAIVFVTLDPLSDSPPALAAYLGQFDARIIGLTGQPGKIARAAQSYGVATQTGAQGLDHSSRWYLLDGERQVARVYKLSTPVAALAQDIALMQRQRSHLIWSAPKP